MLMPTQPLRHPRTRSRPAADWPPQASGGVPRLLAAVGIVAIVVGLLELAPGAPRIAALAEIHQSR